MLPPVVGDAMLFARLSGKGGPHLRSCFDVVDASFASGCQAIPETGRSNDYFNLDRIPAFRRQSLFGQSRSTSSREQRSNLRSEASKLQDTG
jgi:hypothetical protein